jgi:hypothetical protein
LILQARANRSPIQDAISLRSRRSYCGAFARIKYSELDPGVIGSARHYAPKRIDLLDEMTLADPANGGVARHLSQGVEVVRQQERLTTRARGS